MFMYYNDWVHSDWTLKLMKMYLYLAELNCEWQ